jgi:Flp pilus assembly protein TadG
MKTRSRQNREAGQTVIEFAVGLMLLSMVTLGLTVLSLAVYSYHQISSAAREGARYAMVHAPTSVDPSDQYPATNAQIQQVAVQNAVGLPLAASNVTVNWIANPNNSSLWDVQVQVSYPFPLQIPFFPQLAHPLTAETEMLVSH